MSRPVLALWGIEALRRISGALLIVSGGCLLVALARRTKVTYIVALVLPLLLGSNLLATPSTSLNQSLSLAAAFVSPTLTVVGGDRGRRGALLGTTIGAAVYSYVDLMLVPAVPLVGDEPAPDDAGQFDLASLAGQRPSRRPDRRRLQVRVESARLPAAVHVRHVKCRHP